MPQSDNYTGFDNRTVGDVMDEFFPGNQSKHIVYCERGLRSVYGERGKLVPYIPETMEHLELRPIRRRQETMSEDGIDATVQTPWQDTHTDFPWRLRF